MLGDMLGAVFEVVTAILQLGFLGIRTEGISHYHLLWGTVNERFVRKLENGEGSILFCS